MFVNEEELCQAAASMGADRREPRWPAPGSVQNWRASAASSRHITIHGWANEPQIDALSIF